MHICVVIVAASLRGAYMCRLCCGVFVVVLVRLCSYDCIVPLGGVLCSLVVIFVCVHMLLLMLWCYWPFVPSGFLVVWHRCHPIDLTIVVYVCSAPRGYYCCGLLWCYCLWWVCVYGLPYLGVLLWSFILF